MKVLVFRNRFGAATLWVLTSDGSQDAPEQAALPGLAGRDPRTQNMDSKGSAQSWDEWAAYLASHPLLGNWSIQVVAGTVSADEALRIVRRQDVLSSAFRRPYQEESAS